MKTVQLLLIILFFFISFFQFDIHAQNGKLVGVIRNELVEINPNNASLTHITDINKPISNSIFNLTYSYTSCLFYGVIDIATAPKLVSFDWSGNYNIIGLMTVPGMTIFYCEALAVNPIDEKLYAAISFDGGSPTSETVIELDPLTAEGVVISELGPNTTMQDDFDHFTFIDNILYLHDGSPDIFNASRLYKIDFENIGPVAFTTELYDTIYRSFKDLASIGDHIYMPTGDYELYDWDTQSNTLNYIGQTHTAFDYNGDSFGGLEFVESKTLDVLDVDTVICEGQTYNLSIDINDAIVTWNNGSQSSNIEVNTPGIYWADIQIGNCMFISDTAYVNFKPCVVSGACNYFIPNAISPNGNGINDIFKVYFDPDNCNIQSVKISIFNRWGGLLLETNSNEWDGTLDGKKLNDSVFTYKIEISVNQSGELINTIEYGTISLLN